MSVYRTILNDFKSGQKLSEDINNFWAVLRWTENVGEWKLVLNDFKSEWKMSVNINYFEWFWKWAEIVGEHKRFLNGFKVNRKCHWTKTSFGRF